ncbi:BTAD domain-containing putative transcriptional regulator [Streptomyces sp. NPDC002285]
MLNVHHKDVDATLAEILIRRRAISHAAATVSALRPALALWRGESLADVKVLPWFKKQAERLDSMRLEAESTLLEARLELGEHVQVLPELERAVAHNPYREHFYQLLMLALYRADRQADALDVYHRLRGLLDDELGISPGPALRALEEAILRQDVSLDPPAAVGKYPLASKLVSVPGRLPSGHRHTSAHPPGMAAHQSGLSSGCAATAVRSGAAAAQRICQENPAEHGKVSDPVTSVSPAPTYTQDITQTAAPAPIQMLNDARADKEQTTHAWNDLLEAAYRSIAETGRWDDAQLQADPFCATGTDEVLGRLTELRLIEPASGGPGTWRSVSPNVAMARAVVPLEEEARDRARHAESVRRQIEMMLPVHQEQLRNKPQHGIEVISDEDVLHDLLNHELAACSSVLTAQATADPFGLSRAQFVEAATHGTRVRGLFQHSSRYDLPSLGFFEEAAARGVSLRTTDEIPVDTLLFDRSTYVILLRSGIEGAGRTQGESVAGDRPEALALVVRHPLVISLAADVYERMWASAAQFEAADPQPLRIADGMKRMILSLLATGCKDEHIARRVGISVRTCRRYIATILAELEATSRFQAGVRARELGLL